MEEFEGPHGNYTPEIGPHISHFFPHTHFRLGNFSPQNYTGGLEYFGTFRINCQKIPLTSDT